MRSFGRLLRFEHVCTEIYVSHETVLHACSCRDDGILQDPRFRRERRSGGLAYSRDIMVPRWRANLPSPSAVEGA